MGYLHILNLVANKKILANKVLYAQEKIHGTSAHISLQLEDDKLRVDYSSGGAAGLIFRSVIDAQLKLVEAEKLVRAYAHTFKKIVIYGEAFGGKLNGMKPTYGDKLHFWAFDVQGVKEDYLDFPPTLEGQPPPTEKVTMPGKRMWCEQEDAQFIAEQLGLKYIPFVKTSNDITELDRLRDLPSAIAALVHPEGDKRNEGIVIKTPVDKDGQRDEAKHKQGWASEKGVPASIDPERQTRIEQAQAYAQEWVNDMRVQHIIDHVLRDLPPEREKKLTMRDIPLVLAEGVKDVRQEAAESGKPLPLMEEVDKEIGREVVKRFSIWVKAQS